MVKAIIFLIGLTISFGSQALTEVTASVDKNPVIANESFVLTVIADDDIDTNALDTSALGRDFIVGRTSVSSQTSMVNFKTTRTTKWRIVLIARKPGEVTIPSLSIEDKTTAPIKLKVIAASESDSSTQQDLFITTEVSAKEVYVQQQLTLTVKLHFAAELKRGSLTEPELNGANINQIGKDKESETIINGRRYRVIERTYAISPQQSGEFVLKSPIFSGEIMMPSSRRNSFLSFAESKPVSVIGDEIPVVVKAIPAQYQGMWLPSELLSVHQEWQPETQKFVVGEPITRIITLTAAGLSEEQLPEIDMPMPEGLKVYPDQAQLHTGLNNNRLVSQKVRNFAIVANKAGTYHIPEIVIPWWNTVTNQYQEAKLPAQTIVVEPNPDQPAPTIAPTEQPAAKTTEPVPTVVVQTQTSWLQWLFLALWLITLGAWAYSAKRNKTSTASNNKYEVNDSYLALLAACKKNEPEKALGLLVPWYNTVTNHKVSTIAQIQSQSVSENLKEEIHQLQACQFGKSPEKWQGQGLAKAIQQLNKTGIKDKKAQSITLNP